MEGGLTVFVGGVQEVFCGAKSEERPKVVPEQAGLS